MRRNFSIQKLTFAALLALGIQVAYAALSFTGFADEKTHSSNKFSLKNLSLLEHKGLTLSFSSLKSNLQFKGMMQLSERKSTDNPNTSEVSTILRYENGNTTYIYPYKFKVKTPKFKTPAPPVH